MCIRDRSPGDFEAVRRIATEVKGPIIAALARTHPDDIDRAAEALAPAQRSRIHVFMSTSPIHMEQMLNLSPAEVLASITEGVTRARSYCDDVEFSPCLLYTSDAADDLTRVDLGGRRII